jgi:Holliday junction resolvasome RuvABC endonuclease subunit
MKILALDIATKTGWCNNTSSGVWDFSVKRGESIGMRLIRFRAKVLEMISLEKPDVIVYELPAGLFKASIMVASEMIGVLKTICEDQKIEYAHESATEIKKFATGKGNAKKEHMIKALEDVGIKVIDDNHADAIHLFNLFKSKHIS